MKPCLNITKTSPVYNNRVLTHPLSFFLDYGEVGHIVGSNGSGKTSLLKCLIGECDYQGVISVFGQRPPLGESWLITGNRVSFVSQGRNLPRSLSVTQFWDVWETLKKRGRPNIEAYERDKRIGELSIGQQKMLAIKAAVTWTPDLVIADEPFSGLDKCNVALVIEIIAEYTKKGGAFLFSSHPEETPLLRIDREAEIERR